MEMQKMNANISMGRTEITLNVDLTSQFTSDI